jgi:hypothetical protein
MKVERLLARLEAALPSPARVTPELAATLQAQNPTSEIPLACSITWISYAGDEGGDASRHSRKKRQDLGRGAGATRQAQSAVLSPQRLQAYAAIAAD